MSAIFRRLWRSRPHAALVVSTLVVAALAFAIPLSRAGRVLGFVDLPIPMWLLVVAITAAYVATVELVKRPVLLALEHRSSAFGSRPRHLWVH